MPELDVLAGDLSTARLASGTRDNLLGALAERVLGIVLFVSLSFLLTPRELGTYYEIVALVTILVIAGVMGIDMALVRFTALEADRRRFAETQAYVRSGIRLAVGTSAVLASSLWIAAPELGRIFGSTAFVRPARVGAVAIPFLVLALVLVAPARGLKLMWPTVLSVQICQPAVALVASCGLVLAGFGLAGATAGFTVAAAASCLLAAMMLRRLRPKEGREQPRASVWRPLVRFSLPVAGMTLTGTALLWVDTLLLGAFRPATDVATYGIIVRLMAIGSAVMLTVIQIFGPFVTQLVARGDRARLGEVLHTATRWVALVAAPPLVLLAVSGQTVLRIFHQPPWPGHAAMLVLAAAFLIDAFTGPVGHVLTMSGRSGLNLATNAAALVCNVALNLVLIPRFGLVGAAVAWAVVIVAVNAVRVIQVRVIFGVIPFERSLARPAIALVGAAALAAFAGFASGQATNSVPLLHLAIVGGTFAVAYGGGLTVLGASSDDRLLLRTFLRPRRGRMAVPTTTAAGSDHATRTGAPAITRTSR